MPNRRARARALFVLIIVSMLALGCRAEFDIDRDVAAAGYQETAAEAADDSFSFDDDDGLGAVEEDLDITIDEDGSFSFGFSTSGVGDEGRVVPDGPGSEPDRDMSWNGDPGSVLEHLASIAPPDSGLTFTWKTVAISDDESVTGPFPDGWEISEPFLGVTLEPGDDFDFFTDAELDAGCQGSCSPQDWGVLMDDPELSPFAVGPTETVAVLQDLAPIVDGAPDGRLLVTLDPDSSFSPASITVTRWSDEASHFLWCAVSLDEEDVDLWPVMADMCAAMRPDWIG